ncbi:MAG: right-handed parallel beta-helix repeat-containing protein [Ginsengibacter sp.]
MKKLIIILFLFLFRSSLAVQYYVSNLGSDSNNGTDPTTSWQTLSKVNSMSPAFVAGDRIYFKRGDTFSGTITLTTSGTVSNKILIASYGSIYDPYPVITGFTTVTAWTNLGSNIWESTNSVSSLDRFNIVVVNGVNTPMGRYPNSGYVTYQSHSGDTAITASGLPASTTNWTGADIVIRKNKYTIDRGNITFHVGNTLHYKNLYADVPTKGFGTFIENDPRTLDVQNEWYYNVSTGKIRVYSVGPPTNVKVPAHDYAFKLSNKSYINIEGLAFEGFNRTTVYLYHTDHISVTNCTFTNCGQDAVNSTISSYNVIQGNSISQSNKDGVVIKQASNDLITNNTLNNIGLFIGMPQYNVESAIYVFGNSCTVTYNKIDSVQYHGIMFEGTFLNISNNFISHACIGKDDGGGTYTSSNDSGTVLSNNIVLNVVGNTEGTPDNYASSVGFYFDSHSQNIRVENNTVSGSAGAGIMISNAQNMIIRGNTSYNNSVSRGFTTGELRLQYIMFDPLKNISIRNNILANTTTNMPVFAIWDAIGNSMLGYGISDSNYYVRPLNNDHYIYLLNSSGTNTNYNLSRWRTYSSQDAHSFSTPKTFSSTNSIRFEYNATQFNKTVRLDAKYIDVKGNVFNGTITLAPYASSVLFKDGNTTSSENK